MTDTCTQISDGEKKSSITDFSGCIFNPKLETAPPRVWISLMKGRDIDSGVWEILGKQNISQDFCVSDLQ